MKNEVHKERFENQPSRMGKLLRWGESSSNLNKLLWGLIGLCVALFVIDFVVHRHTYAPYEATPGFYSLVGFLAISFFVLVARIVQLFVTRDLDYYSDESVDNEEYPADALEINAQVGASTEASEQRTEHRS